jgi:hypothetical protein
MTSASIAVTLSARQKAKRGATVAFGVIALIFIYTTVVNVVERPDGVKIASFFIAAIVVVSVASRLWRQTELRTRRVVLDQTARRFVEEAAREVPRFIAHDTDDLTVQEYLGKEEETRWLHDLEPEDGIVFLEVTVGDPSEFAPDLTVSGHEIAGHRVLRAQSSAVPNAIATFLLYVRNRTGKVPHAYFEWTEGNPLGHLATYVLFGEGEIAPVTREILRQAEPRRDQRPIVHVG